MSLIEIKHLRKEYSDVTPLKDVNASIEKGEVISIIGPSGTGKSTLLRCINRLEVPSSGQIIVDGVDMCDPNTNLAAMRRKMGMVFQSYNLFDHLLVAENIMMAPMDLLRMPKQEAWERALKLLDMVGLKDKALSRPRELSGGQRQRVAIARSMALDPEILLLDEPTSALDSTNVSEVLLVMSDLAEKGHTMLVVTHEMRFARDASSRIFYMDRGEIWESGTPEQILENPRRPETHDYIFRVRGWHFDITSTSFDSVRMTALLEHYCARQFMGKRAANTCELLVEELVLNQLVPAAIERGIDNPDLHLDLFAGEGGVNMTLLLDYRGLVAGGDPLADSGDAFSSAVVMGLVERVETLEPGLVRYHIKKR